MRKLQVFWQDSVTKADSGQKRRRVAKFILEVFNRNGWKFRVKTTIKFEVETTEEVCSPKNWKFKVEATKIC